jgi:hypothetical protein
MQNLIRKPEWKPLGKCKHWQEGNVKMMSLDGTWDVVVSPHLDMCRVTYVSHEHQVFTQSQPSPPILPASFGSHQNCPYRLWLVPLNGKSTSDWTAFRNALYRIYIHSSLAYIMLISNFINTLYVELSQIIQSNFNNLIMRCLHLKGRVGCSLLVTCLTYSPAHKMEEVRSSETLMNYGLHYVTFQKMAVLLIYCLFTMVRVLSVLPTSVMTHCDKEVNMSYITTEQFHNVILQDW